MAVDQLHGPGAFTNGRGAPLGRPRADVSDREHAWNAGLQQIAGTDGGPGEKEPVLVASERVVKPSGARQCAEEQEQKREPQLLAGFERHGLQLAVVAV